MIMRDHRWSCDSDANRINVHLTCLRKMPAWPYRTRPFLPDPWSLHPTDATNLFKQISQGNYTFGPTRREYVAEHPRIEIREQPLWRELNAWAAFLDTNPGRIFEYYDTDELPLNTHARLEQINRKRQTPQRSSHLIEAIVHRAMKETGYIAATPINLIRIHNTTLQELNESFFQNRERYITKTSDPYTWPDSQEHPLFQHLLKSLAKQTYTPTVIEESPRQDVEWSPDLTEEGIEPNPGPNPIQHSRNSSSEQSERNQSDTARTQTKTRPAHRQKYWSTRIHNFLRLQHHLREIRLIKWNQNIKRILQQPNLIANLRRANAYHRARIADIESMNHRRRQKASNKKNETADNLHAN